MWGVAVGVRGGMVGVVGVAGWGGMLHTRWPASSAGAPIKKCCCSDPKADELMHCRAGSVENPGIGLNEKASESAVV